PSMWKGAWKRRGKNPRDPWKTPRAPCPQRTSSWIVERHRHEMSLRAPRYPTTYSGSRGNPALPSEGPADADPRRRTPPLPDRCGRADGPPVETLPEPLVPDHELRPHRGKGSPGLV